MKMHYLLRLWPIAILLLQSCSHLPFGESAKSSKKLWLNEGYRREKYPDSKYFSVFQEVPCKRAKYSENTKQDLMEQLKLDLSRKVITQITLESQSRERQLRNNTDDAFSATYTSESIQKSFAKIPDSREEYYFNIFKRRAYGFVYVEKRTMCDAYFGIINSQINTVQATADVLRNSDLGSAAESVRLKEVIKGKKDIENDRMVLSTLATGIDNEKRLESLDERIRMLSNDVESLSLKFSRKNSLVDQLLESAEKSLKEQKYDIAFKGFDDVLMFDPSNEAASKGRKTCIDAIVLEKEADLKRFEAKKSYENSLIVLDELCELDASVSAIYSPKRDLYIKEYFQETANRVQDLIDQKDEKTSSMYLNRIEPYNYVDIDRFNRLTNELEDLRVEKLLEEIRDLRYRNDLESALRSVTTVRNIYPYNTKVVNESNDISFDIYKQMKKEKLEGRPTRYIVELNYSLSTSSTAFVDPVNLTFGLTRKKEMFNDLYSTYEFGLYRKYSIKVKSDTASKTRFRYSQAGIRISLMNPNSGIYNVNDSNDSLYVQPHLFQCEASVILGRFMMFNLGVVNLSTELESLQPFKKNYASSTLGFRIPFGPVHITTEAACFTDFNRTYQMLFRGGISINIGFSRRYNSSDRRYLKNEVEKQKAAYQ